MTTTPARHPRLGRTARTALVTTACALCALPWTGKAQFEITTGTGSTAQNFDTLSNTGTANPWTNDTTLTPADSTLEGWSLFNSTNGAVATYRANDGGTNNGAIYSYGTTGSTERALGGVGSAGFSGYIAFAATNTSASTLTAFTLGFNGEQWRNGGATSPAVSAPQTMTLEYGFGATFDTVTWTAPGSSFNWTSPVFGTTAAATVDGNVAGLVAGRGGTVNGLSWTTGQTLWIRWIELNDAGNDHGLAIDNFALSWVAGVPPKNLIWTPTSNAWDTSVTNWKDTSNNNIVAFTDGDTVTFDNSGLANNNVSIAVGGVGPAGITVDTTGTYSFTGGPINAVTALQKAGTGTLNMGASYAGGLNAVAGTVHTTANEVFGDGSSIVLADGVTFDLNGQNETVGPLNLTGATITTGVGLLTANGNVAVHASPTDAPTTISGNYSTGAATRIFNIEDGAATEDLILNANLTGSGRINFDGGGTVRITGNNSAFSGGLQMDPNFTFIVTNANVLGTGVFFFNGGIFRAETDLTGANKLNAPVSLGNLGGGVTFEGQNIEFGGDLSFFQTAIKSYSVAAAQTVTFSGTLTSNAGANSAITKIGPGTLVLSEDGSAYTGAFTVNGGTVIAASANALGSGSVTLEASAPDSAILAAVTSTSIGALNGGFGDGTIKVLLGQSAVSGDPVVLTINTSSTGDYNGPIQTVPGRTSELIKTGSGTQRLAGANSYTGSTTVSGGTLQFGKKVSLYNNVTSNWTAAKIIVGSGATLALNIGGTDEFTAADVQALASLGTATGGFADGAILGLDTTNSTGGTFTYSNVIADPNGGANDLGLTKLGSGTLILTAANTYTGPTTALAGELVLTQSQKMTSLTIGDGATVTLAASAGPAPGAVFEDSLSDEPFANEVAGTPMQAVPEPGAIGLLTTGLLGLLGRRHRRR